MSTGLKCATTSGVSPGLGFVHTTTMAAKVGGSGVRGAPRGDDSQSGEDCCAKCLAEPSCTVWVHRTELRKCYMGNCSAASTLPCLERMRTSETPAAQPAAGVIPGRRDPSATALLCTRPAVYAPVPRKPRASEASGSGLALLLLGHRARLMMSTLPPRVIAPTVASGTPVDLFALLENSTMAKAFRGRRPMGHPELAALSDAELEARIARDVEAAGGHIARIAIRARPLADVPSGMPERLSRYTEHVKRTVATRFLKEKLGLQMVVEHEAQRRGGLQYAWVLWTREDSHWFLPFDLSSFARGHVHGKACGGFGGWNDKVWLMDREWAPAMLTMYDEFHTARESKCTDLLGGGEGDGASGAGSAAATTVDFLAAPSVEQFRERVGKLRRVPFVKHPPERLPTMDSYYSQRAASSAAAEGGASPAEGGYQLCFPRIYAHGCVPKVNQSAVDRHHTCA